MWHWTRPVILVSLTLTIMAETQGHCQEKERKAELFIYEKLKNNFCLTFYKGGFLIYARQVKDEILQDVFLLTRDAEGKCVELAHVRQAVLVATFHEGQPVFFLLPKDGHYFTKESSVFKEGDNITFQLKGFPEWQLPTMEDQFLFQQTEKNVRDLRQRKKE